MSIHEVCYNCGWLARVLEVQEIRQLLVEHIRNGELPVLFVKSLRDKLDLILLEADSKH